MYVDTLFPKVYTPSFLDFEPTIWWSSIITPSESQDYPYKHEHNAWLAKKFPFRLNTLSITEEGGAACSLCWHLGGGCYVQTNNLCPFTGEFGDDPRWLYLVLAWRHKDEWDGKPLFPRLKSWLRHLEQMPSCNVEAVFGRATDCRSHKYRHLRLTEMIMPSNATSERLDKCYRKYFSCRDWEFKDCEGKPYLKWKFRPKYPR